MVRIFAALITTALVAAACSGSSSSDVSPTVSAAEQTVASSSTNAIENYPDAQTRALAARAREQRPVENSALPPRHLEPGRHQQSLVDRYRIVSGGPPPDGIPSIDEPSFVAINSVDWLADDEPVAVLTIDGQTKIYPTQILIWHEIVNDEFNGLPIAMTYCPLCNSVVAFEATLPGPDGVDLVLDFGTSGALYQSALVMYDRQTESLWTHFDGLSVIGTLAGSKLSVLPAAMVSWDDAVAAHPDATVLDRPSGQLARPYGTVPYPNYETAPPSSGYISDVVDERLEPKQRVVGIDLGEHQVAVDRSAVSVSPVSTAFAVKTDSTEIIVFWEPGTASALDGRAIADGLDVGSVGVFRAAVDGQTLSFEADRDGVITDNQTGSTWNVRGQAVAGPLRGETLEPVAHLDTFWFAWSGYYPETELVG